MKACIVPPNPGNLSAFGLLAVDWRTDHIVTKVMHEEAIDLATIAALYAGLEQDAVDTLERDGIERRAHPHRARSRHPLCRPIDGSAGAGAGRRRRRHRSSPRLIDAFHAAHLRTFGYNYSGQQKVELVNFCVSGFGLIERPEMPSSPARGGATRRANRCGRSISTAHFATRRSMTARRCRPACGSMGRR